MAEGSNLKVDFLSDEDIIMYSGERVVTEPKDVELNNNFPRSVRGGIYDSAIFGSIFEDTCNCGRTKANPHSRVRCAACGCEILPKAEAQRRIARIELPFYYIGKTKQGVFKKYLKSKGLFYKINSEWKDANRSLAASGGNLNLLQWEWVEDEEKGNYILGSMRITDFDRCGYNGLAKLAEEHPNELGDIKKYLNKMVIVSPACTRPLKFTNLGGERRLAIPRESSLYKGVLTVTNTIYPKMMEKASSLADKVMANAICSEMVSQMLFDMSGLFKASKKNVARQMQAHRMYNSGRAVITPAPENDIDQVTVPRHLMYECCKKEFIDYLMQELNITQAAARRIYSEKSGEPETKQMFEEYINGNEEKGIDPKYVIILRNPTLHQYNMMSVRVKLTDDYSMGLPLMLCSPFNADH